MIDPDKTGLSGSNKSRTDRKIDTPVTQPRSGTVHYELLVIKAIGPFDSWSDAAAHARRFYPDLEQDADHVRSGWDVQSVECP